MSVIGKIKIFAIGKNQNTDGRLAVSLGFFQVSYVFFFFTYHS